MSTILKTRSIFHWILAIVVLSQFGCSKEKVEALGLLEWDRVNGRAVASEAIIEIMANEGDVLELGQPVLKLDSRLQEAQVARLKAVVLEAEWQLKQLQSGYRPEELATAEAEVEGARYNRKTMQIELDRKESVGNTRAVSERSLELTANSLAQAKASERSADERLKMLQGGYRKEEIERAKAKLAAAQAELMHAKESLGRYTVIAERAGLLDSIPFKLGDKPPVGAVVSTVLAGDAPYARVYMPEPWLSQVKVGDSVDIHVDGVEAPIPGTVRYIESNASFTPYYTLSEEDRSRLSFVTEIDLDPRVAGELPLGVPVRMQLRDE